MYIQEVTPVPKDQVLNTRISASDLDVLKRAAALAGVSTSAFVTRDSLSPLPAASARFVLLLPDPGRVTAGEGPLQPLELLRNERARSASHDPSRDAAEQPVEEIDA